GYGRRIHRGRFTNRPYIMVRMATYPTRAVHEPPLHHGRVIMRYDPDKHHRRSIRLHGYDYASQGAYFVTICVHGRACVLGEVIDGAMRINDWGQVAVDSWLWLGQQYPYVALDVWVIMPNHMHGIIVVKAGVAEAA